MRTPPAGAIAGAQAAALKYGVFASVSLGQYALESPWGAKATGRFNFFGIKGNASNGTLCWTHEVVHGQSVACQQWFRNFDGMADAFDAHAALIALDHRYAAAMAAKGDLDAFVRALGPVYATDPTYADKLLELIREEGFMRYDAPAGEFGAAASAAAVGA